MKSKLKLPNTPKVLFISYDGLTDSLGQSQILSYLKPISEKNIEIHILSFEKSKNLKSNLKNIEKIINKSDIHWHPLPYHKSPPVFSTIYDIYQGINMVNKIVSINKINIIHCRGYISGLISQFIKKRNQLRVIFDMRGWWPDEKKESGLWDSILYLPVYKYFKNLEKKLFEKSDYIVSLTYAGKNEIQSKFIVNEAKIGVIPTCVNFDNFPTRDYKIREAIRNDLGIPLDQETIVYSGSIGANYPLDEILKLFSVTRSSENSFLILLTKSELLNLEQHCISLKLAPNNIIVVKSEYLDVYKYLHASDMGLIYYRKSYSVIGRSPTKLGEYWATGLPVIGQQSIGDLNLLASTYKGLYLMDGNWKINGRSSNNPSIEVLYDQAKEAFSLEKGVEFYYSTYFKLLNQ